MSIFGNLTNEGLEETQDRLGGYKPKKSGIYDATIKAAYAGQSPGGARSVTVLATLPDGSEYSETIYVTNRNGENFFVKDGKKIPLPGFTTIDDLCLCADGKPLSEQPTEDKMMDIYDSEKQAKVPKSVPVLGDLTGKPVTLAILHVLENKNEKQGDKYVPTAATRESNTIDKVFHTESGMTTVEARTTQQAEFKTAWEERNKDQIRDKRTIKDGEANGTSGRPGSAPTSQGGSAPRKSLFGK